MDDARISEVESSLRRATEHLRRRRRPDGSWCDRLSSSPISTALSVLALHEMGPERFAEEIETGLRWLHAHQRPDGGWSDADTHPPSSKSGTAFTVAALHAVDRPRSDDRIARGFAFLDDAGGAHRIPGMRGPGPKTWPAAAAIAWALVGIREFHEQPPQPTEVMLLPHALRNKVSIALPGVLGVGLMQNHLIPVGRVRALLRRLAEPRALAWLRSVVGPNGGIEECPMLGALILIALHRAGVADDVQTACLDYLLSTRRADGSWAIDRDLEISSTRYVVLALSEAGLDDEEWTTTREWLLARQSGPFPPMRIPAGGWAWAQPSGWPEPDDTAGVLEALTLLGLARDHPACRAGLDWLVRRQDRQGSWCGWVVNGKILNDKPCPAVTAQVVAALIRSGISTSASRAALDRAVRWLRGVQKSDGTFHSLWFRRPVFGTTRVLETLCLVGPRQSPDVAAAVRWLLDDQRTDGSWPGGTGESGTVEETGWALFALLDAGGVTAEDPRALRAVRWLCGQQLADGRWHESPVALYFDDLRYASDLIADTAAFRALARWRSMVSPGATVRESAPLTR